MRKWLSAPAVALTIAAVPTVSAPAAASNVAFGEYLSGECTTCHQRSGESNGIPAIVGWPSDQFVAVLRSYKLKDRPNEIMQSIAARLGEVEMEALAAYFASLAPPQAGASK
jgi:cytochrome c